MNVDSSRHEQGVAASAELARILDAIPSLTNEDRHRLLQELMAAIFGTKCLSAVAMRDDDGNPVAAGIVCHTTIRRPSDEEAAIRDDVRRKLAALQGTPAAHRAMDSFPIEDFLANLDRNNGEGCPS